jgi:RimJ/RimL family protein N-acetyltransferase
VHTNTDTHRSKDKRADHCGLEHFLLKMPAMLSAAARGPAYRIITDRLVIRCWGPDDAVSFKLAIDSSLPHLRPWVTWAASEPSPLDQKVAWLRKARGEFDLGLDYAYGIFSRDESEVIGGAGLHLRQGLNTREIGYWIASAHCQKGYATEVSRALTRVGFEVDCASRIEIRVWPENRRSVSIPERLGFIREGTLRGVARDTEGRPYDVSIYALLRDDYECGEIPGASLRALDVTGQDLL